MNNLGTSYQPNWVYKQRMPHHESLKEYMLNFIDDHPVIDRHGVTKEDFNIHDTNKTKPDYYNDMFIALKPIMTNYMKYTGYVYQENNPHRKLTLKNLWFHQYEDDSMFDWHHHDGAAILIYYIETDNLTTEVYDPYEKKVFMVDAQEGDVVMMPAYVPHRSPVNKSGSRKTILAGNFLWNALVDVKNINRYR